MITLKEIRQQQYEHHKDHDRSPYTWFKARLYMNCAAWVVYKLQKEDVKPSDITAIYGLLGVIGWFFLWIPYKPAVFVGLLVFYFKGILDWADGHLARLTNKVSEEGARLDVLCGKIGAVCFYAGIGGYLSHHYGPLSYLWVALMVIFLKAFGYKISLAAIVDLIIFLVGLHCLLA